MSTNKVNKYVLMLEAGLDYIRPMTWQSVAEDGTVSAIPLTGKILVFQLEKAKQDETDFILRSDQSATANGSSITLTNGPQGKLLLIVRGADITTFRQVKTKYCIFYINEDSSTTKMHNDFAEIKSIYG